MTVRSKTHPYFRLWFWTAFTTLLLAFFFVFSSEVSEANSGHKEFIGRLDELAALWAGDFRSSKLNAVAIELTALGSTTLLSIFAFVSSMLLIFKRRFASAFQIIAAAVGAGLVSFLMKSYFERPRPVTLPHLVDVQGFSYPSGHSLGAAAVYFTFAILLCEQYSKKCERLTIIFGSLVLITLIALSRVYLGVHYASDTIAGVLIGISWATAVSALGEFLKVRIGRYGNE